jgi:hypothetical protein
MKTQKNTCSFNNSLCEILRNSWELLAPQSDYEARELHETDSIVVPLGTLVVKNADGTRHILLPVTTTDECIEDRRSSGVQIRTLALEDAGSVKHYVDIVCLKPELRELFILVAANMIEQACMVAPERPDIPCREVLQAWRELLSEIQQPTSLSAEIGAFAELWNLNQLQKFNKRAIANWNGPLGSIHDFDGIAASLEVKGTLERNGLTVTINGLQQLETIDGKPLYLSVVQLEEVSTHGQSIASLSAQLMDAGVDRYELCHRLARIGICLDESACRKFRVIRHQAYEINESFPKITPGCFAGGVAPAFVVRVQYTIDLSGPKPSPLTEPKVGEMHRLVSQ